MSFLVTVPMITQEQQAHIERRYLECEAKLSDPDTMQQPAQLRVVTQEFRLLQHIREKLALYQNLSAQLRETEELLRAGEDPALSELARNERESLLQQLSVCEEEVEE